ncbi:MAG: hypothetical protein Q4F95_02135 [Oscillospiraceae bacterium]|nr:hypothetical protein [Oscillospiraceae bacterium]
MKRIMIIENNVKVTIHIPDDVSETVRQQKINRLYDILKPKIIMERKEKAA